MKYIAPHRGILSSPESAGQQLPSVQSLLTGILMVVGSAMPDDAHAALSHAVGLAVAHSAPDDSPDALQQRAELFGKIVANATTVWHQQDRQIARSMQQTEAPKPAAPGEPTPEGKVETVELDAAAQRKTGIAAAAVNIPDQIMRFGELLGLPPQDIQIQADSAQEAVASGMDAETVFATARRLLIGIWHDNHAP